MLTFIVRDTPVAQGSKSAFALRKGGAFTGRAVVVDDTKATLKHWREAVRHEAQEAIQANPGLFPLEGPVVLAITFTVKRPGGLAKRMQWLHWPFKRPDIDKYLRSVLDALKSAGVYADDAQVVEFLRLAKHYQREDASPVSDERAPGYMLGLAGTALDVLSTPGVVVRVAHMTEFAGVQSSLEKLGLTAEMVPGGR